MLCFSILLNFCPSRRHFFEALGTYFEHLIIDETSAVHSLESRDRAACSMLQCALEMCERIMSCLSLACINASNFPLLTLSEACPIGIFLDALGMYFQHLIIDETAALRSLEYMERLVYMMLQCASSNA